MYFKPRAVPLSIVKEVELGIDEMETLHLCDLEGLDQVEAAKRMKISQATFCQFQPLPERKSPRH